MSEQLQETTVETVNEWDSVIVQINNGEGDGAVGGSIRMMKQDINAMIELHGVDRGYVLDMLLKALETTQKENFTQKEKQ